MAKKKTFIVVLYGDTKLVTKSRYLVINTSPNRIWLFPDRPKIKRQTHLKLYKLWALVNPSIIYIIHVVENLQRHTAHLFNISLVRGSISDKSCMSQPQFISLIGDWY